MKDKKELIRAVKFTLLSISAGIIETVVFELLSKVCGIEEYWTAYLPALILSVLWNFTLNRKVTFHSANNVPIAMLKVAGYYAVFTPLSAWGGDVLTGIGWNADLVFVLTMLLNFVTEYMFDRFFVFGNSIDTAK